MEKFVKKLLFSLLLLMCVGPTLLQAQPYPVVQNPANGHWYYLHLFLEIGGRDCLNWAEARDFASTISHQGMRGHLATITSAEEDSFLKNYLMLYLPPPTEQQERKVWIGGYQLDNQSATNAGWRWVTGEPWLYSGWNPGEPNDCCVAGETNQENCLEHHYKLDNGNAILGWNDENCGECLFYFLIEFEPTSISVPTLTQWGTMVFICLLGLTYIYYLKRRKKAEV